MEFSAKHYLASAEVEKAQAAPRQILTITLTPHQSTTNGGNHDK